MRSRNTSPAPMLLGPEKSAAKKDRREGRQWRDCGTVRVMRLDTPGANAID